VLFKFKHKTLRECRLPAAQESGSVVSHARFLRDFAGLLARRDAPSPAAPAASPRLYLRKVALKTAPKV
jgi:hypothetical protein